MKHTIRGLVLLLGVASIACTEPAVGITVPLSGTDTAGRVYVLDGARFEITGPVSTILDGDSVAGSELSASLPPGDYAVELLAGWQLVRLPEGTPMMATLVSANPQMATVTPGVSANVVFVFDVMGEIITMTGDGDLDIGFEVHDTDGGLGDGGATMGVCAGQPAGTVCRMAAGPCDAEEVCDGMTATCPADVLAPAGTSCGAGLACDATASCVDIDECLTDNGGCDPLATCTNTVGGRTCGACPAGTVGDGTVCSARVAQLATGVSTACAVLTDGRLYCWGANQYGQLGQGDTSARSGAVRVGGDSDWATVSVGAYHVCGIRSGQLYCWGQDYQGQLGDGIPSSPTLTPARVGGASGWTSVDAGSGYYTCGIESGALYCWGDNHSGQLGDGSTTRRATPLQVGADTDWTDVSLAYRQTCGVRAGGLYCWGYNYQGSLGIGASGYGTYPTPQAVPGFTDWVHVAVGSSSACGIRATGAAYCWGYNGLGGLGIGSTTSQSSPAAVGADTDWTAIEVGSESACGVRSGALYCWGRGYRGALGNGGVSDSSTPVRAGSATDWVEVGVGTYRACAVASDGRAECWGDNGQGLLLSPDIPGTEVVDVRAVAPASGWTRVRSSQTHTLALRGGELWAWGGNSGSALGRSGPDAGVPERIGTASDWSAIDAGYDVSCGIRGGDLYCWGRTYTGIGTGTIPNPTRVGSLSGWTSISLSTQHVCGIRSGELWCWGRNDRGQVGDGSTTDVVVATRVGTDSDWAAVVVGIQHTCGIRGSGHLYCWGDNDYGQLGDGTTMDRAAPTPVGTDADWTEVGLSYTATCGLRSGAGLFCWGSNSNGQLGTGGGTDQPSPYLVDPSPGWSLVDGTGFYHSCAIRSGLLYCWGRVQYGIMGDGNPAARVVTSPTYVTGAMGVGDAAMSVDRHFWIVGGSLFGVGRNWSGEVGVGLPWRDTPAPIRLP